LKVEYSSRYILVQLYGSIIPLGKVLAENEAILWKFSLPHVYTACSCELWRCCWFNLL